VFIEITGLPGCIIPGTIIPGTCYLIRHNQISFLWRIYDRRTNASADPRRLITDIHNELSGIFKPAKPNTIKLFDKESKKGGVFQSQKITKKEKKMKTSKFILAAILTISLFLMTGSAGADLLYVGTVEGSSFSADDTVDIIYDDAQNFVWADFTSSVYTWYDASDWAKGIDGDYSWDEAPLEFSGGWRLPTVDELFLLWSEGLNSIPEVFSLLREVYYWTAPQQDPISAYLFSMQSGESIIVDTLDFGFALAVRDVEQNSQVPEPSSLILLVLGFIGFSGVIRSRKISGRA